MEGIRLNKYISDSGICSRREADKYISELDVTINGKTATLGSMVYPGDRVNVAGRVVKNTSLTKKRLYIAFNKPSGVTCTTDPRDKNNIVDYINHKERIFNIGRLDKLSEGLIFLTNDGDIVNKILRAGNNHEKEYIVTVNKDITEQFITKMGAGIRILGTKTQPCKVHAQGERVFRIVLTQGLNRQIRKMCEALDYKVVKLIRVRIMNISLGSIKTGEWRYFTEKELLSIQEMTENSSNTAAAPSSSYRPRPYSPFKSPKNAFKTKSKTSPKPTPSKPTSKNTPKKLQKNKQKRNSNPR